MKEITAITTNTSGPTSNMLFGDDLYTAAVKNYNRYYDTANISSVDRGYRIFADKAEIYKPIQVTIDFDQWDGNVAATLRKITKEFGWLEKHAWLRLKDTLYTIRNEWIVREKSPEAKLYKPVRPIIPAIKKVIFSPPVTVVLWADGSKTIVRCSNNEFEEEIGFMMAVSKKMFGSRHQFKKFLNDESIVTRQTPKKEDDILREQCQAFMDIVKETTNE